VNEFRVAATQEALDYLRQIAAAMQRLFAVQAEEAAGRIAEFWAGQSFQSDEAVGALLHQGTVAWAKSIYYGRPDWWRDEASLNPAPYPKR
jgi:hypothetical protein